MRYRLLLAYLPAILRPLHRIERRKLLKAYLQIDLIADSKQQQNYNELMHDLKPQSSGYEIYVRTNGSIAAQMSPVGATCPIYPHLALSPTGGN